MIRRLLMSAVACVLIIGGAQSQSKNLIVNGTFEAALGGESLPEGWFRFAEPGEGYKFTVGVGGRSGKALLIEGAGQYGGVVSTRIELDRAQRYAARGYVKIEGDTNATATVKLDYYAADGKFLGSSVSGFITPTHKGWQVVGVCDKQGEFSEAKSIAAVVALTGKGKAWFDDLELIASPASPGNLLTNGSIDAVVADKPTQYYMGTSEGGKVTMTANAQNPKDGSYALNLKGNSEWAVAGHERVKFDKSKTYTLSGFARARTGTAQIKIDYFEGDKYLGMTFSDEVTGSEWTRRVVVSSASEYPTATHISATCVGLGEMDCDFDGLVLMAK